MSKSNFNKSTDELIVSDGSIEELFIPPLELRKKENLSNDDDNASSLLSETPKNEKKENKIPPQVNEKQIATTPMPPAPKSIPIPAVRKSILAPIVSTALPINGNKDHKNNKNELKQKQQKQNNDETISKTHMITERSANVAVEFENIHKSTREIAWNSTNEPQKQKKSKKKSQKLSSPTTNAIVLSSTLTKEEKRKYRKHFTLMAEKNEEETTSLASYREKHEAEDNVECMPSHRLDRRQKESEGGNSNESVSDSSKISRRSNNTLIKSDSKENSMNGKMVVDDGIVNEVNTIAAAVKVTSKAKKSKSKLKKKRGKKQHLVSADIEQVANEDEHQPKSVVDQRINEGNQYDFKNVISISLHETSALRFDPLIRHPRVRISIYDVNDSGFLHKSNPLRNAVLNYEPTNVTFIQPILSDKCTLKESRDIECNWHDEQLLINEDIRHIQNEHVVIFFEVVDILSSKRDIERTAFNGWYHICWAFLKPGDGKTFSNIGRRCALQLYHYQRLRSGNRHTIYDEWRAQKRIKYPGFLSATVGAYQPALRQSMSLTRPMSVLEEELTGDIYTNDLENDNDEIGQMSHCADDASVQDSHRGQNSRENQRNTLSFVTRLPGQQCRCPNRLIYKHKMTSIAKNDRSKNSNNCGSMIAKFSPNGSSLAFHYSVAKRNNHEIIVLNVSNLQTTMILHGHLNIVYELDWLDECTLISVSSDRTAIVWMLSDADFTMKILPHPSFVYTVKWLNISTKLSEHAYVATGGRDCIVRIWKIYQDDTDDVELCNELEQHQNYITSLVTTRKSTKFYTSDWNGVVLEWMRVKQNKENASLYGLSRKIKIFPTSVLRIELHPKSNRLYVQCANDRSIYVIETTSTIVIQKIDDASPDSLPLHHYRKTFTLPPCGHLIFSTFDDRIMCTHLSNDGHENAKHFRIPISLISTKTAITSLAYHPNKYLMACSVYGDLTHACLFLISYESDEFNGRRPNETITPVCYGKDVDLERDLLTLEQWNNIRSDVLAANNGNGRKPSTTFDSILNRIDDLFFMAIRTPKHTDDYEQLKEMQTALDQLRVPHEMRALGQDVGLTEGSGDGSINSPKASIVTCEPLSLNGNVAHSLTDEAAELLNSSALILNTNEKRRFFVKKTRTANGDEVKHVIDANEMEDLSSTDSRGTFVLKKENVHELYQFTEKKSEKSDISGGTYNIQSNNKDDKSDKSSNLTFEIVDEHQQRNN